MSRYLVVALVLSVVSCCVGSPVYNPSNGHYYEVVPGFISWYDAMVSAASRNYAGMVGHLTTITSAEETSFVVTAFVTPHEYWIGGYQDTSDAASRQPAGGWRWVTGEQWSYTNWQPGEPNDSTVNGYPTEDCLVIAGDDGGWNDMNGNEFGSFWYADRGRGYIVEYDVIPEPLSIVGLACGLVSMFGIIRRSPHR